MRCSAVAVALFAAVPCFAQRTQYQFNSGTQDVYLHERRQTEPGDGLWYSSRKALAEQEQQAQMQRSIIWAGVAVLCVGMIVGAILLKGRKHDSIHHPRPTDGVPESGRDPDQGVGDQGESPLRPVSGADVHPQVGDP